MSKGRLATDTGISIGQVFLGKYRVEEILGQGGMGIVARCTHLALNEQVAVKMLRADVLQDDDATARFMREAQAAVKLRSEYVARVSDVGTFENGVPYMVMEYLDGQDLGVLLEEQGSVAAQWATDLMLQAAEALAEAHSISIVHRDVKPTNLFVTWRPDGTSLIKVLDFGISKSPMGTDMQLTQTQSLLGTPAYMSPEQMRSARLVDQRTDIWSLGTVLYELLEGRRPFEADSFSEMCVKVAVDAPEPMVNAPPGLQQVVLRCLAKSPEQRYANMAELGRDLVPFARDTHAAQMMVERMFRMLGRQVSSGTWEGPTSRTPVPQLKSGPARAQTPVAWHGGSDPAAAPLATLSEPLAAVVPVAKKKSRSGLTIAVVASVSIAIAAAVMFYFQERGVEPVENVTTPAPALDIKPVATTPPPDPTVTAPQPDDQPAAVATEVPKPADEIKKVEPAPAAPPSKKPGNKKPKPAIAKKPPDKPYDKVRDPKHVEKAKDPKDELAKPAPPPVTAPPPTPTPPATKRDVYATPRAEK